MWGKKREPDDHTKSRDERNNLVDEVNIKEYQGILMAFVDLERTIFLRRFYIESLFTTLKLAAERVPTFVQSLFNNMEGALTTSMRNNNIYSNIYRKKTMRFKDSNSI